MKIALIGDSFIDEYVFGDVERIAPEAPIPVLDVLRREFKGGGVLNVANNLVALEVNFTLFTITSMKFPFPIVSPKSCTDLRKTRYIGNMQRLLRVDEPKFYLKKDLANMIYPHPRDFDIIAFADYNKGIIKGGKATIVDSKKKDLGVFAGSQILKVNRKEWDEADNGEIFSQAFVTNGKKGIDYFEYGSFRYNEPTNQIKEVIDTTGAGDTVLASMIYCLANGITNPKEMMGIANKAAGIKISKFGTAVVTLQELLS